MRDGHQLVVYDRSPDAVASLVNEGAVGASTIEEFVARCQTPRVVCLMIGGEREVVARLDPLFRSLAIAIGARIKQPGDHLVGRPTELSVVRQDAGDDMEQPLRP